MSKCKTCSKNITDGNELGCPNCGARLCTDCAKSTLRICPYCYYDLEYMG